MEPDLLQAITALVAQKLDGEGIGLRDRWVTLQTSFDPAEEYRRFQLKTITFADGHERTYEIRLTAREI